MTCWGQDTLSVDYSHYNETSISLGYNYSFADPNDRNFHLIETRFQKQKFGGRHPAFTTLSAGIDIGLNTNDFVIGPRVGGIIGFGGFFIGTDLAYYTDLKNGTLRLIPSLGFGYHQFRLSINPHIRLINKDFEPIDRGHVNLTIKAFKLKRKRLD